MQRGMIGCVMNNKLKRFRKKVVVVQFEVLSRHLPETTEETTKITARIASIRVGI
jgi:hypothetical protein